MSRQLWIVRCPQCPSACTGAEPPGSAEFIEFVPCVLCGTMLDVKLGRYVKRQVRPVQEEPIDLLSVE